MKLKKQKLVYSFLIIFFLSGSPEYVSQARGKNPLREFFRSALSIALSLRESHARNASETAFERHSGLSQSKKIKIEGGNFTPLFQSGEEIKSERVASFLMDALPVTNKNFYDFLQKNPAWKKENLSPLSADREYLKHWIDGKPLREQEKKPVTYVSWFAANAYCESMGGKLPEVLEWEYVAAASSLKKDATRDDDFVNLLLSWYSKPFQFEKLKEVGNSKPNFWGVYDMHSLIWEWNYDFNSVFVTSDSRQDKDVLKSLFCGAGGLGAANKKNYAAFMRYALRSSLKAHYTLGNLGFRCVYPDGMKLNK